MQQTHNLPHKSNHIPLSPIEIFEYYLMRNILNSVIPALLTVLYYLGIYFSS